MSELKSPQAVDLERRSLLAVELAEKGRVSRRSGYVIRMLVHRVLVEHWPVTEVAISLGVSTRTVYKWLARYRAGGVAGLQDRSSVALHRPHAVSPAWVALVRLLRHGKLVAAEIADRLPLARSTISAILTRIRLGRLHFLTPPVTAQRYEWQRPGELIHESVDGSHLGYRCTLCGLITRSTGPADTGLSLGERHWPRAG